MKRIASTDTPGPAGPGTVLVPPSPAGPDVPPLTPRKIRRFGWRPDTPDARDKIFSHLTALRRLKGRLPSKVDLREYIIPGDGPGGVVRVLDPVLDQGDLGSCTGNAIAKCYAFQHAVQGYEPYTPSRLFIYYGEREMEGTIGIDAGAEIRDGLKVLEKLGAPHESLWPYRVGAFTSRPDQRAYDDALKHNALSYQSVNVSSYAVRLALASKHPVVIGFTVYESFYNIGPDGIMPVPKPGERVEGGHAVLLVGYKYLSLPDPRTGRKVPRLYGIYLNSWGESWGDGGYFYAPLSWMCNLENADDFWTILIAEGA